LICATNFLDGLDPAVLRRFNHKIKFNYLNTKSVKTLFESQLLPLSADKIISPAMHKQLESCHHLTPGDFKVVLQRNYFKKETPASVLLEQLIQEMSYKQETSKRVGL
jgi:AAA+ superfamily predicted ATPase